MKQRTQAGSLRSSADPIALACEGVASPRLKVLGGWIAIELIAAERQGGAGSCTGWPRFASALDGTRIAPPQRMRNMLPFTLPLSVLMLLACGASDAPDDPVPSDSAGEIGEPGLPSAGSPAPDSPSPGSEPDAALLYPDAGGGEPQQTTCSTILTATVRDFEESHPDFEVFQGDEAYTGLVRDQLGEDGKPVYAHSGPTPQTAGPDAFSQWYRDVPGVNMTFTRELPLAPVRPGVYGFGGPGFFPLDGDGFGNSGQDVEGQDHNFHFTTEVHTEFVYTGGEVFTFTGDDDMWLFVNHILAIDLGGLHSELTAVLDLDDEAERLGIVPGNTYAMDIFHAERHTEASNFYLETTIGCFQAPAPK